MRIYNQTDALRASGRFFLFTGVLILVITGGVKLRAYKEGKLANNQNTNTDTMQENSFSKTIITLENKESNTTKFVVVDSENGTFKNVTTYEKDQIDDKIDFLKNEIGKEHVLVYRNK